MTATQRSGMMRVTGESDVGYATPFLSQVGFIDLHDARDPNVVRLLAAACTARDFLAISSEDTERAIPRDD